MCFEAAESGWEQNNVFEIRKGFWHSRNWATGIREDRHDDDECGVRKMTV